MKLTDEDGPDGERHTLGIDVRRILVIQHVVGGRDRSILVADDGELQFSARDLVDVLLPQPWECQPTYMEE